MRLQFEAVDVYFRCWRLHVPRPISAPHSPRVLSGSMIFTISWLIFRIDAEARVSLNGVNEDGTPMAQKEGLSSLNFGAGDLA
jgi:hypothetical protein